MANAVAKKPHVRPWALAAPILILLLALPLLRPLHHPTEISAQESRCLEETKAYVEQGGLWPSRDRLPAMRESNPVFPVLLSGPYWVMHRLGLRMDQNAAWVAYLLTVIAVTIPVAASAGLIYRMARSFELPRSWRSGLSFAVILASGMFSYATVLNPHAPAAAALLASVACLIHVAVTGEPLRAGAALMVAGFMAAVAAVMDFPAQWDPKLGIHVT